MYHDLSMRAHSLIVAAALLFAPHTARGQAPVKEEFEVVAIRPFDPGSGPGFRAGIKGGPGTDDPTRMIFSNSSIYDLVIRAYSVAQSYQLVGPDWLKNKEARFVIEARVRPGATTEQANEMIKNLLADRFHLVLRRETKQLPVHVITIAKGGHKLKEAVDDPKALPLSAAVMVQTGTVKVLAKNKTIEELANRLTEPSLRLGPVFDQTGLTRKYDFTLEFALERERLTFMRQQGLPVPAADAPPEFPELPRAIQEQLGLKIDLTKAPIEIFTVETVSKTPTEN